MIVNERDMQRRGVRYVACCTLSKIVSVECVKPQRNQSNMQRCTTINQVSNCALSPAPPAACSLRVLTPTAIAGCSRWWLEFAHFEQNKLAEILVRQSVQEDMPAKMQF